ncbi:MAG TPA: signal peptide peptidase SppA [Vicinamibacteria bacterium]|nr:signal peptide peptidase SppA [Vicinamibacteria bacterium]
MKRRTAWILVAGVAAVSIGAAAVGAVAYVLRQGGGAPSLGGNSCVTLDVEGDIPEAPPQEFGALFERRPPSLKTLVESLDRAAKDPKVTSVLLRVGLLEGAGWGKVQELRDAVARFRTSKKPVYAHIEYCGNKEYYLATAADKIYAIPTAIVNVSGLAVEVMFFRGTLDKLGIEAQFEGVGKYKNAPNTFTEKAFTDAHREQMEALVDGLYGQYRAAIARSRGLTEEAAQRVIDGGPYDGEAAKAAGLVDELLYHDEIQQRIKGATRVAAGRYARGARGLGFDARPKFALIYAVGEIIPGESRSGGLGGDAAGSDTVSQALRDAREDDGYKAIILRVDSPGGFGPAADVIRREVQLARKEKPVVVSMGDYAASGGYYVTIGSDAIVAQPATITGSIGVFSGKFSLRGFYDKLGITKESITRGRFADLFTEYRPWSGEERRKIHDQNVVFYEDFVRKVAEGRGKSWEEVDAVAQGRVWTGEEALEKGLVDRLGGLDAAVSVAREKAKLGSRDVALVILPERKGFLETVWERQQEEDMESAVPRELRGLLRWARAVTGDGPIARLPFDLRVR